MIRYDQIPQNFYTALREMSMLVRLSPESGPCGDVSQVGKGILTSHTLNFLLISLTTIIQYYLAMLQ